jgi:uncharacterized secreted protein with C-terminal beta-propeller domain
MENKYQPLILFIVFLAFLAIVGFSIKSGKLGQDLIKKNSPGSSSNTVVLEKDTIAKFTSDADFITAMNASQESGSRALPITGGGRVMMKSDSVAQTANSSSGSIERSSTTNVQVVGIDEPDIVKTEGSSLYYSKQNQYGYMMRGGSAPVGIELQSMPSQKMMPPRYIQTSEIVGVNAVPPASMQIQSSIPENGEMLISDKVLVVFTTNTTNGSLRLVGYSLGNPSNPQKLWELPFSKRAQKIAARLYNNSLYLITSTSPTLPRPCPMPLIEGKTNLAIRCTDVYIPSSRPMSNAVYSVLQINPRTGSVAKSVSFIGQTGLSTIYMSKDSLYLSYVIEAKTITLLNTFIQENRGILPQYIADKINKLQGYDLSESTKEMEMNSLLSQYLNGMDDDERLKQENQLSNAFKNFSSSHKRSFESTGIIKIKNDNLAIQALGKVPGVTLNQFSFDEWKGDLRVATTIGGRNSIYALGGNTNVEQVSDIYVLGENLEIKGSVKDMGKTERIYSVRFLEDRGYVVTFRQTDPFYVVDLSNAYTPTIKGELKIPGYSSYLHPIDSHLILGIGRENQVKLSLFDVTDPTDPKEVSHYELSGEYWSEAMDNHHAFVQDPKYKIFFLPGSRGGYIFSYGGNTLSLVKAVESPLVKRGLYLNDYFYMVTDTGITSYKEGSWNKVGEVTFDEKKIAEPTPFIEESPIVLPDETRSSPPLMKL